MLERGCFQEMDYKAVFGTIAKWVVEITDPARIPSWSPAPSASPRRAALARWWCVACPRRC